MTSSSTSTPAEAVDIDGLAALLDLELPATWDLGSVDPIPDVPFEKVNRLDAPVITSNAPIAIYDVIPKTDGDKIPSVRPESYEPTPPTYNGSLQQIVAGDVNGTEGADWLTAQEGRLSVFGAGGDDLLAAEGHAVLLVGGRGDDALYGLGGDGDDTLNLNGEATGYGGAGTDRIQLDPGTTAFADSGDDFLAIRTEHDAADTPVMAGGAGADVFDMRVWNQFGTSDTLYARITDFDPAECILQVGVFQTAGSSVDFVELDQAQNGAYTDVRVPFQCEFVQPPGIATIRLDGVIGLSPDQVVIAA